MNNTWLHLKNFVEDMKSTTSTLKKKEIIERYSDKEFVKECIKYTLDPFKMYYVTSKNCKKNSGLFKYNTYDNVFDLLEDLDKRVITGHDAIAAVNGFCTQLENWAGDLV